MKREWITILVMALTFAFTAATTGTAAHHEKMGHKMKSGHQGLRGFLELKLTDKQQTDMLKIIEKYHEKKQNVKARKWEAKEKLTNAIYADTFDEDAIRKASQEVSSIKEELAVLRAKMFGELKTVLSPEQVEKFRKMKSQKYGR